MGGDYCFKCAEIYYKKLDFLAIVPKLGIDAKSAFYDSKSPLLNFD